MSIVLSVIVVLIFTIIVRHLFLVMKVVRRSMLVGFLTVLMVYFYEFFWGVWDTSFWPMVLINGTLIFAAISYCVDKVMQYIAEHRGHGGHNT